jgi:hypothetical protein
VVCLVDDEYGDAPAEACDEILQPLTRQRLDRRDDDAALGGRVLIRLFDADAGPRIGRAKFLDELRDQLVAVRDREDDVPLLDAQEAGKCRNDDGLAESRRERNQLSAEALAPRCDDRLLRGDLIRPKPRGSRNHAKVPFIPFARKDETALLHRTLQTGVPSQMHHESGLGATEVRRKPAGLSWLRFRHPGVPRGPHRFPRDTGQEQS